MSKLDQRRIEQSLPQYLCPFLRELISDECILISVNVSTYIYAEGGTLLYERLGLDQA